MNATIVTILQAKLSHAGYDPGAQDGIIGSRTYAALFSFMAKRPLGDRGKALGKGAAEHFGAFEITTPLRLGHWCAQATHETENFIYLHELWGPTDAQKGYQGRADLGNTHAGDGFLFRGRGVFQLTGRANYTDYGRELGLDLVNHPELAEDPETSVLIACAYWKRKGLNALADADDVKTITRRINGGLNGFDNRKALLERAKLVLGR
jgi:putative chitinase